MRGLNEFFDAAWSTADLSKRGLKAGPATRASEAAAAAEGIVEDEGAPGLWPEVKQDPGRGWRRRGAGQLWLSVAREARKRDVCAHLRGIWR